MKSFGDQLTLFNPITFQGDNNWGYQTYSQGDRVYGTNSLRLGTVIEATPKAIKVLKDNGETEIVECHHISKVKLTLPPILTTQLYNAGLSVLRD